jgi:hypothetical protein
MILNELVVSVWEQEAEEDGKRLVQPILSKIEVSNLKVLKGQYVPGGWLGLFS